MNKRGDMPFWLVMLIWTLIGAVVILLIIKGAGTKMTDLLGRLG